MRCPHCNSDADQRIFKTRKSAEHVTRRRRCAVCAHTYSTTERLSEGGIQVRKLDGRVLDFSRDSVRRAVRKAAVRQFSPDRLDAIVEGVVQQIHRQANGGAVDSQIIGEALLGQLRKVDHGSHIRFALVHRGRQDRADGSRGWDDVKAVLDWLHAEYPELEGYDPPARLRIVVKRDGTRERFDRKKLEQSIGYSSKGRGSRQEVYKLATVIADDVESALADQPMVTSGQIASEIIRSLRRRDHVAYLRFASTAKRFDSPQDYYAETTALERVSRRRRVDG